MDTEAPGGRIADRALPAPGAATTGEQDVAAGMLGLPGFRVLGVAEFDGELQVQTTADHARRSSRDRPDRR